MKIDFMCPKCRGYLNVGENLVFTLKRKGWKGGVLLLSPTLGDYTYTHHPSFRIEAGDKFDFHCPICDHDLTVEGAENFARVILHENEKEEFFVVFSKVKGEKCTFKLSERKVEESFGEHSTKYFDAVNASMLK